MDAPAQETHADGIAVVAIAGRFPKARNCDEFWSNLVAGRECLSHFDQAAMRKAGVRATAATEIHGVTRGVVEDADLFDAALFGLSPREAEIMDPQQRLFLEVAWEAIEQAGYDFDRPPGSIGVFVGCGINTYFMSNLSSRPDVLNRFGIFPTVLLNEKDFLATRLAYRLNLRGPALNIQTACSTSLVAVCHACQSLLNYECDMALAGAAHLAFPQCQSLVHGEGGMISQDGHCRPFDHRASGTIFSDGVGVVALRRVEDAIADGDNILAVIRGYGLNNDGLNKAGFTAPSVQGQADVIKIAQAFGDIDPDTISYMEAHGTGTRLGDPIEIAGLTQAFREGTDRNRFCGIGSVKSNIGHLDVAAGVAGLIKTVLAIHHGKLPATINFESPNPEIDFDSTPFFVVDSLMDWPAGEGPRRAGVSSFGIGGTNAHVVLEEAPRCQPSSRSRTHQLLVLSAQSPEALEEASQNLAKHLEQNPSSPLSDVAFTLQTGRHAFAHRKSLVCQDPSEAARALREGTGCRLSSSFLQRRNAKPVFMFPGQGAQRVNMGRDLYEREQVYRETVDQCARILEPELGLDIRNMLFPEPGQEAEAQERLTQTWLTQPALFVTEYALAKLWQSWGIRPQAMIGHSVGEYTAACLANVFSLEVGLKLIATRGRLIQGQPPGSMLAIMRSEAECRHLISNSISIAAVNAPSLCVVAGESEEIESLANRLQRDSIVSRRLQTSHAFHSMMMEPVIAPFAEVLSEVQLSPPTIPFISNVTGKWIEAQQATSPDYWTTHLRSCVKFAEGVETVLNTDGAVLIEVGPGQTLTTLSKQHPAIRMDQVVITSLPASRKRPGPAESGSQPDGSIEPDQANMLEALGQLWQADVPIDWNDFYRFEKRQRVPLPSYPFQRKRYWIEPGTQASASTPGLCDPEEHCGSLQEPAAISGTLRLEPTSDNTPFDQQHPAPGPSDPSGRSASTADVQDRIVAILHELSGLNSEVLLKPCTFVEMGFDSLFLTQLSRSIFAEFNVEVTFRQLIEEQGSLSVLADYLASRLPDSEAISPKPLEAPLPQAGTASPHAQSFREVNQRLEAISQQVEKLATAIQSLRLTSPVETTTSTPTPASRETTLLPLTDGQREIWLATQLSDDASRTFNESYLVTLEGNLHLGRLEQSIQQLIDRHDALRITFLRDGSFQRVEGNLRQDVQIVDLQSEKLQAEDSQFQEQIAERIAEPFNLEDGPLSRFILYKLSSTRHVLLIVFHHIILDGWSWGTLLQELGELYHAKEQGCTAALGSPARFADYIHWDQSPGRVRAKETDLAYWRQRFAEQVRELELPADHVRPAEKTFASGYLAPVIDAALTEKLREVSRRQNCTLFSLLFAAFQTWLYRITQQQDIVVGVPVAGQLSIDDSEFPSGRNLVGHCVSMLPIRTQCNAEESFESFLKTVNANVLDARDHQAFTFGNLLESIHLKRDASRIPIVSVTFNLARAHQSNFGSLKSQVVRTPKAFNYFDLTLDVIDFGDRLVLDCKFNRDMFDRASVESWMSQFRRILEQAAEMPKLAISSLSLLSERERENLLVTLNQTDMSHDRSATLHRLLTEQARRTPHAIAIRFGETRLTYAELDDWSTQLAHYLRAKVDIQPDTLVGVCMNRSPDMLVALLAVLKSGAAYVPLDPTYPTDRIGYILQDSGAAAILTEESLREVVGWHTIPVLSLDRCREAIGKQSTQPIASASGPRNLAYVIYTSGSTGKPKGVQIEHQSVVNFLTSMARQPGFTSNDVLLAITTISFDIAVLELYLPLMLGATIVLAPRDMAVDARAIQETLDEQNVTVMQATPATWRMMLKAGWKGRKSLKALCGGEALTSDLARDLIPRCGELWNMYGPTETTVWSTCCQIHDAKEIHIGRPIGNTLVYIVDQHMHPTPTGIGGELLIGGDGLARGYRGRPQLTAEKFIPNPFLPQGSVYRTGDLAKYRHDGTIECLGRMDFQVKVRGFRIELGEIETVLTEHPGVRQAVVVATPDGSGEHQLIAYCVPASTDRPPAVAELRATLRSKLPEYMVPSTFSLLTTIPMTPNGKVDRKALPGVDSVQLDSAAQHRPKTPVQKGLAEIWKRILAISNPDIHTSFFDLGGHSLLAVEMFQEVERLFNVRIPLGVLIKTPTIAGIAEIIEAKQHKTDCRWPSLLSLNQAGESSPELYLVHGAGGDVLLYQQLVKHLGEKCAVLGLQSQGIDGETTPLTTISDMAQHYVREIREAQPYGPYRLAGYCLGGTIAYEMAQILQQQGQEVQWLALLDTYNFEKMRKPGFVSAFSQRIYFHSRNLLMMPWKKWPNYVANKFRVMKSGELRLMLRSTIPSFLERKRKQHDASQRPILDLNQSAAFAYVPKPYTGVLTIIKPRANYSFFSDAKMGWGELASDLEIIELNAFPHAMLEEPAVEKLASTIIEHVCR